jgi:hypothetical protein
MRKVIVIAGLILATGILVPAGALGKAGGTDRPIKDRSSGTTVVNVGDLTFALDATGIASHLGRTTSHLDGALTPTGPSTFDIAGTSTVVAANGDELYGTFSGSGTSDAAGNSEGPVVVTFTGGTGRFKHASGSYAGSFSQVFIESDGVSAIYATYYSLRGAISR